MSTRERRIGGREAGRLDIERQPRTKEDVGGAETERSLPELLRELSGESAELVRQEVALAKAEMSEKLETFQRSALVMAVGGALMLAALLTALWAVNQALTALLATFMALGVAVWLAPLILTAILAIVGWSMIRGGRERMKEEGLRPERTERTLREDGRWARSKAREIREEMTDGR
jgi:hypothetical protein